MFNQQRQQIDVVGCLVDVSDVATAAADVLHLAQSARRGYVCLANVHMCMTAGDDADFAAVLGQAALVFADGRPIFWAQRLFGAGVAQQVRGVDLMLALCREAEAKGLKLGFYGGEDEALLADLSRQLLALFPRLQLVYRWAPPFRPLTPQEDAEQCQRIQEAAPDLLFVGLGCPKQEFWMAQHQHLDVVMLGVGAAFDFIAGRKQQAPRAVQRLGIEWLHRLLSEPARLAGRYIRHNPRFLLRLSAQWASALIAKKKDNTL